MRTMTVQRKIKLRPDEVKNFVAVAARCEFDIDIAYNRYIVDAKSFLGVMGLDFNSVLTVSYNGYDETFEQQLSHYAIAC
ncbi:MAG: HPr family phosphocarrier protein [Lachnospiraceae bacterium]|nr:HPr family phosphocarrier protein [Lachnospiraceae bacterium]